MAAGADPVEFASLLVALVPERRPAFALGMAESPSATRHRILRLLAMKDSINPRLGIVAGVAGWVVAIGLAITLAMLQYNSVPGPSGPARARRTAAAAGSSPRTFRTSDTDRPAAPPWGDTPLVKAIARAAAALPKSAWQPPSYVVEPPDILLIDAVKLVPKAPYHIEPLDVLQIGVANTFKDLPFGGQTPVDSDGAVELGAAYGKVLVAGQSVDEARKTIETQLKKVIPDVQISVS
ncbi:MAG TPA: polysaccharide biosynthesis/export family protein, partial [Pirellulales bacterium]